jgi:hypothetical protein
MTANTAQSEAWNGDEGQYFVAQRARHERMGQQHTARLLAAAAIGPAEVVLDVGCGCGETTIRAARAARSGHALGVDLSAVMLAEARRPAGHAGVRSDPFGQAMRSYPSWQRAWWTRSCSRRMWNAQYASKSPLSMTARSGRPGTAARPSSGSAWDACPALDKRHGAVVRVALLRR